MSESTEELQAPTNRRSFLRKGLKAAGSAALGARMITAGQPGFAKGRSGGGSLNAAMSQKVYDPQVLQVTLGIGGDEIAHFL